jgi:hypothetical protein
MSLSGKTTFVFPSNQGGTMKNAANTAATSSVAKATAIFERVRIGRKVRFVYHDCKPLVDWAAVTVRAMRARCE